jgi:hypothetical protein
MCSHIMPTDHIALYQMRAKNIADFIFVWTFDNHHNWYSNVVANALADVVVPSHKYCANYMRSACTILGTHIPLATNQWSRARARALFAASAQLARRDGLHGSFVDHKDAGGDRAKFANECRAKLPENAIRVIDVTERHSYFDQSAEDRWHDWARHKIELVLPITCDLSFRVFDSLLVGQVPLVPSWCRDLDQVIPLAMQQTLPVMRFGAPTVQAVEIAWREAIRRFDAGGEAGMLRRHMYALENHHLANRLKAICSQINDVVLPKNICFTADQDGIGFVLTRLSPAGDRISSPSALRS